MADIERGKMVAPDTLKDAVDWLPDGNVVDLSQPIIGKDKKRMIYLYPVTSATIEWLNIIYNEDAVLRYKINIKRARETNVEMGELTLKESP